jgi:hypothetical protein
MVSVLFLLLAGGLSVARPEVSPKGAAAQSAAPQEDVLAIDESLNGSQYINRTAKFSLVLPPDWIVNKEVRHSPSTLAWLSTPDKRNWVGVTKEQDAGSLENFKQVFEVKARTKLTNYEKLSESSVTIDGKAAVLLSYRVAVPNNTNLHVVYLVAIVPSGDTYSTVMAWCGEPGFQAMRPIFEKILRSYRGTEQACAAAVSSKP